MLRSLAVPFHFTTTFLVAVSAYAAAWLALSRARFSPTGWARWVFALGWLLLAAAETIHGAQSVVTDQGALLLWLRSGAYLAILIALVPTALPEPKPKAGSQPVSLAGAAQQPPRRRAWAMGVSGAVRVAGPAVLGLGAAVVALRSRLEGARRLALGLGLLGAAELFFSHGGGNIDNVSAAWWLGHGLQLLGGLALGVWLWRAFRVSIQARFVAALVLLLIMVIALISFEFTNVFVSSTRNNALDTLGASADFEGNQITGRAGSLSSVGRTLAVYPGVAQLVQAKSTALQAIANAPLGPANFLAFFDAQRQYLATSFSAPDGSTIFNALEALRLAGLPEVQAAVSGTAVASVADVGTGQSRLILIGATPVSLPGVAMPVGALVLGQTLDRAALDALSPLPAGQQATILDSHGRVLVSQLPGSDKVAGLRAGVMSDSVFGAGKTLQFEGSIGRTPYYAVIAPLRGADGVPVAALMLTQKATLQATESNVSRYLFLGALAATLFAVGASTVSGFQMTRPIRELTEAAERVRQGDLTVRVPVAEADEVGALSQAFNQMTTALDAQSGELREAAEQESRLRGQLETVLQSMTDGLIAVDLDANVLTINREAERIFRIPADQARGRPVQEVLALVDATGAPVDLPVYRLGAGSTAGHTPGTRPDRAGTPVAVTSAPITDERTGVRGAVAVIRDLTAELAVEQMKTEFLSNISHELRTPLTPIKGYADLLRRKVVPRAKSVSFLNVIVASTERMERIVDMLVDFSAMQAGRLMVRPVDIELERVTLDLVRKWRESAPNHSFERAGFADLPAVAGDTRLLPRAIDELLDNAVKFSPDGGVISLRGSLDGSRTGYVRVSVVDHGIGISSEQLTRILQDFVQVDASETRAFGGLGLGLAYVRRIIEALNGELQVQSRAGEGSTFTLLIPVYSPDGAGLGGPWGGPAGPGSEEPGPAVRPGGGAPATPGAPIPVEPLRRAGFASRRTPPEWPPGR